MDDHLGGNLSTSFLKIIALVSMFCDHLGKMVFPAVNEFRIIGRIAFPIYAWCLVVGVCKTHDIKKYALRLLIVGLISQPLYMISLNHTWNEPNIFFTLLIGLLGLYGMQQKKYGSQYWAPLLALLMATDFNSNYGWKGILFIFVLYLSRNSKQAIIGVMIAFCLLWGTTSKTITSVMGFDLNLSGLPSAMNQIISPWLRLQALAILALPFIAWNKCNINIKMPKWIGYSLYPAHLLLLYLIELIK